MNDLKNQIAIMMHKAEVYERYLQHDIAWCTNCAMKESPGFYTGCLYKDGHDCNGYVCDGKGLLLKAANKENCDE